MRKRRKRNFYWFLFKSFLMVLLISSIFLILTQKSTFTNIEYRISKLEKKKVELLKEKKYLLMAKVSLASIGNIKGANAKGEGFYFPDRKKIIYVRTIDQPEPLPASYPTESKTSIK
ncbi:MAG: hypothetical protein N2511_00650 [Thermodesulfovibrionales bacterium]|nr:hypothetical protein [Thermodesulfovibrionales bacterium]